MKKLLVFSFLGFFAVPSLASAQQIMIGGRAGVNLGSQNWTYNISQSIKPGILGGFEADMSLNPSWAASIQLLYDQKGTHADHFGLADGPLPPPADWTMNYIEVPLLAKLKLGYTGKSIQPYFFAGPSIGFLVSNIEKRYATTVNITDSTAKIDFCLSGGAGLSISLSSGTILFLDAGYAFGLTNTDNYYYDKEDGISIYSRDIRLAAGVLFPIR